MAGRMPVLLDSGEIELRVRPKFSLLNQGCRPIFVPVRRIQQMFRVQRIELNDEKLSVDGRFALARTGDVKFAVQKAARSIFGSVTSGEGLLSTFEGTGTVLIAPIPNVFQHLYTSIAGAIPKGK